MQQTDAAPRPRRLDPSRLLVLAGAVAIGLGLQHLLGGWLAAIEQRAATDVIAARRELATLLRVVALGVFGSTGSLGAVFVIASRRALRDERFPPPGVWTSGSLRSVTGSRARRLARVGIGLGAALVACSLAGSGLLWWAAARLLSCPVS